MESFPTPYPVIFFDGEQEQDKGFVDINSVLTFKRFQSLISQKMGFPPSQLSAFFMCRRMLKDSGKWQRLPITVNTNFSMFLDHHNPNKDRDCYFLVSLKKPKRDRRGSRKWNAERDIRDEWNMSSTKGSGGRGQTNSMDDAMSHVSMAGLIAEADNPSLTKQFPDEFFGNKIADNKSSKVILKRSPHFHRQSFKNHLEDLQKISNFTFQQKDPKDMWEDTFARVKEWGLQSYPYQHVVPPRTVSFDSVFPEEQFDSAMPYRYGPVGFDHLSPEGQLGQVLYRNKGMVESLDNMYGSVGLAESLEHNLYRNNLNYVSQNGGILDHHFLKPKPLSFPFGETDGQQVHSRSFEFESKLRHLPEGNWQNVPAILGTYPHSQGRLSSSEYKRAEEDTRKTMQCSLCFDCKRKNISPVPFHWCVEDAITKGFQGPSPAGPIGRRPKNNQIEAAA